MTGDIDRARALRHRSTFPERLLWSRLRNRGLRGAKFRRQHPIGSFVVDFYCADAHLVIELDGESHDDPEADVARSRQLEQAGLRVVRVTNDEVLRDLDLVLERISTWLSKSSPPRGEVGERSEPGEGRTCKDGRPHLPQRAG